MVARCLIPYFALVKSALMHLRTVTLHIILISIAHVLVNVGFEISSKTLVIQNIDFQKLKDFVHIPNKVIRMESDFLTASLVLFYFKSHILKHKWELGREKKNILFDDSQRILFSLNSIFWQSPIYWKITGQYFIIYEKKQSSKCPIKV